MSKCIADIATGSYFSPYRHCLNTASMPKGTPRWCWQHDPERIAYQCARREAAAKECREVRERQERIAAAERAVLDAAKRHARSNAAAFYCTVQGATLDLLRAERDCPKGDADAN